MCPASVLLILLNVPSLGHEVHVKLTRLVDNLVALFPLLPFSLALAALIVFVLIPKRTVYLLLFVWTLTAGLYWVNPHLMTYAYHGMIHLGYVYATQRNPWPPEDPYLAGTPLYYPWAYHALVARISSTLQVAPSWIFTGCNLAALAVSIVVVERISRLLNGDRITANCTVVLAVLAPTFLVLEPRLVFEPLVPAGIDSKLVSCVLVRLWATPVGEVLECHSDAARDGTRFNLFLRTLANSHAKSSCKIPYDAYDNYLMLFRIYISIYVPGSLHNGCHWHGNCCPGRCLAEGHCLFGDSGHRHPVRRPLLSRLD